MPALVAAIAVDLNKLFENGRLAAYTLVCKGDRVVIMAICRVSAKQPAVSQPVRTDFPIVLIVRVVRAKDRVAHRARKVLNVELFAWRSVMFARVLPPRHGHNQSVAPWSGYSPQAVM